MVSSARLLIPCLCLLLSPLVTSAMAASADDAWKDLVALDAGPKEVPAAAAEGRRIGLEHFARQEKVLRAFLKEYPADPRRVEARLRLARVLQLRADVQDLKVASPEVNTLIDEAAKLAQPEQRADVEFARLSYSMRITRDPTPQQRQRLLDAARSFQGAHPSDRRLGPLFAEIATLFDLQPKTKQSLLLTAQSHATDDDLKSRITDDLRRVELIGQEIPLRFVPPDGGAVDIADYRGKVVVVVFFAAWSPPAVEAVMKLQKALPELPAEQVQIVGVSLDKKPEPLESLVTGQKVRWPIICDGQGWESPLVRSLGINSLPTVWLLDREGRLRSLNALKDTALQVKEALSARK